MEFQIDKKKQLSTALSEVMAITEAAASAEAHTSHVKISANGKRLTLTSIFAESYIDAAVTTAGEAVVSVASLHQVLRTAGESLSVTMRNGVVKYKTGRVSGAIDTSAVKWSGDYLEKAPPKTTHVFSLGDLLGTAVMKKKDAKHCTLHVTKNSIRSDATDDYRGVIVKCKIDDPDALKTDETDDTEAVKTDEKKDAKAFAVCLSQNVIAVLAKFKSDAKLGFSKDDMSCQLPGLRFCVPLDTGRPIDIVAMTDKVLATTEFYGEVVFNAGELIAALADVISAAGDATSPITLHIENGSMECAITGIKGIKVETRAERVSINTAKLEIDFEAGYLRECLVGYDGNIEMNIGNNVIKVTQPKPSSEYILERLAVFPTHGVRAGSAASQPAPPAAKKEAKAVKEVKKAKEVDTASDEKQDVAQPPEKARRARRVLAEDDDE